jgi:hypothetical protein
MEAHSGVGFPDIGLRSMPKPRLTANGRSAPAHGRERMSGQERCTSPSANDFPVAHCSIWLLASMQNGSWATTGSFRNRSDPSQSRSKSAHREQHPQKPQLGIRIVVADFCMRCSRSDPHTSSICSILRWCRPPSNGVSSHTLRIGSRSVAGTSRSPIESTFESLCSRA